MSLFENFPWTNLHQLNLGWLIEEVKKCYSPDNPPEAMVISVNGESGNVTLYKDAHVALPDITEEQWNLYRGSANKITGIEFNKDAAATRINGNQRFVIYDAGNPPPYPVIAVNGETGNVILYEEPYAVFPDVEGNNWGLERKLNTDTADETRVGIMFDDTGKAYITHDEDATQILTIEDIPSSSGVVSVNGKTGIVNLTGENLKQNENTNTTIEEAIDDKLNITDITDHTEVSNVATRAYAKNEYIIINNVLYKVTAPIAINDAINSNNSVITNICKELKEAHDSLLARNVGVTIGAGAESAGYYVYARRIGNICVVSGIGTATGYTAWTNYVIATIDAISEEEVHGLSMNNFGEVATVEININSNQIIWRPLGNSNLTNGQFRFQLIFPIKE